MPKALCVVAIQEDIHVFPKNFLRISQECTLESIRELFNLFLGSCVSLGSLQNSIVAAESLGCECPSFEASRNKSGKSLLQYKCMIDMTDALFQDVS